MGMEDRELVELKRKLFFSENKFEQYMLTTELTLYFSPFRPLLRRLRGLILFSRHPITLQRTGILYAYKINDEGD